MIYGHIDKTIFNSIESTDSPDHTGYFRTGVEGTGIEYVFVRAG